MYLIPQYKESRRKTCTDCSFIRAWKRDKSSVFRCSFLMSKGMCNLSITTSKAHPAHTGDHGSFHVWERNSSSLCLMYNPLKCLESLCTDPMRQCQYIANWQRSTELLSVLEHYSLKVRQVLFSSTHPIHPKIIQPLALWDCLTALKWDIKVILLERSTIIPIQFQCAVFVPWHNWMVLMKMDKITIKAL